MTTTAPNAVERRQRVEQLVAQAKAMAEAALGPGAADGPGGASAKLSPYDAEVLRLADIWLASEREPADFDYALLLQSLTSTGQRLADLAGAGAAVDRPSASAPAAGNGQLTPQGRIYFITVHLKETSHAPGVGFTNMHHSYGWAADAHEASRNAIAFCEGAGLKPSSVSSSHLAQTQELNKYTFVEGIHGLPEDVAAAVIESKGMPAEIVEKCMSKYRRNRSAMLAGLEILAARDAQAASTGDQLVSERQEAADREFESYDLGPASVESCDGWSHISGGNEWSRTLYVRPLSDHSEGPAGDDAEGEGSETERWHMTVRFAPGTAAVAEVYALTSKGNLVGRPCSAEVAVTDRGLRDRG